MANGTKSFTPYSIRLHKRVSVPSEAQHPCDHDYCPHCKLPFDIEAIDRFLSNVVLFICPSCGLARAESRAEARRKVRKRIAELDRLLVGLKYLIRQR
jgi:transposase-like protein